MKSPRKEERRCHPRMETTVHLRPSSIFGDESCVYNISLGGMRIRSQRKYGRGEVLKAKFSFTGGDWTDVNMRVVWIRKRARNESVMYDIGCEFVDIPFDAQNELWMLLDKNSREH